MSNRDVTQDGDSLWMSDSLKGKIDLDHPELEEGVPLNPVCVLLHKDGEVTLSLTGMVLSDNEIVIRAVTGDLKDFFSLPGVTRIRITEGDDQLLYESWVPSGWDQLKEVSVGSSHNMEHHVTIVFQSRPKGDT